MKFVQNLLKLLKTDTAKDASVMTIGTGVAALLAAVFFIVVARLGPEILGIFSLATAAFLMFTDVFDISLNASLIRFVASELEKKTGDEERFLKFIFKVKVAIGLAVLLLVILFAAPISRILFTQAMPRVLILAGIGVGFQLLFTFGIAHFQARKLFIKAAVSTTFLPGARLLGLLVLVVVKALTTVHILAIYFLTTFLATAATIFSAPLTFLKVEDENQVARRFFKYNLPLTLGFAFAAVSGRIDNFILANIAGTTAVGYYAAAFRLFTPLQILAGTFSNVFAPRFAGFDNHQKARRYLTKAFMAVGLMSLGLLVFLPFSPHIISIIFGSQYLPAVPALRILFFGFAVFLLQAPFTSTILFYLTKSRVFALISALQLMFIVTADLLLIPRYGQVGAALAFLLTQLVVLGLLAGYTLIKVRKIAG